MAVRAKATDETWILTCRKCGASERISATPFEAMCYVKGTLHVCRGEWRVDRA